jgi:hypothetical protein
MDLMLLLSRPGGPPPPPWILLLVPVVFLGATWLTNHLMGIDAMYQDWPADSKDPIERNLGWQQVEFGTFRGHCPMSIKFGQRCLHLKQPFPFQPMFWKGPASIPWGDVLLEKEPKEAWWAFLSATEFRLGQGGRMIRLRGKAAKALMTRVMEVQGPKVHGTEPPVLRPPFPGPGAIQPK